VKPKEPYSEERAMQYALRSLGRRMQSRAELERKLALRTKYASSAALPYLCRINLA